MAVTIDGLISGIDTETIISGLLEIQQTQVDRLNLRKTEVQQKQAAFRGIEARLLSLRTSLGPLSRIQNSPFSRFAATVSDETAVAATASSTAAAGVYQLTVNSKARAHQVASQGFADRDAEITQGTVELRTGSGEITTITVDGNNNTLEGLASAINSSDAGISASVIRDAAGGATPYRLLLTSSKTGEQNAITINNQLAASSGNAVQPTFDLNNPVQAATDAEITLGSGAGAIDISSSSNRFDDVIAGVSIDLLQVDPGQEITITVAQDSEGAVTAVEDFVSAFNATLQYIDDQSKFNAETNEGGPLLSNRGASTVQQKLRSAVLGVVPGVSASANRLASIGISVTDSGRLSLNKSRLQDVLSGRVDNVSSADVRRLFSLDATSTNSGISFVLGTERTQTSETPWQVDITQAAEQATLTADNDLAASTVITSANRTLELKLDGQSATVTLSEGTYTRQELADHLEAVVNESGQFPGRSLNVSLSGNQLKLTSESYGGTSDLLIEGGTALSDLGLTSGQSDVGRNVAGNFIVNGVVESATGRGRVLSGNSDNEHTADLQIRVTLTPAQVSNGVEGDLTVTRGIASSLDGVLGDLLKSDTGTLSASDDAFDGQIDSIQKSIDRQKAIFDRAQTALLKQFTALESAISQLNTTSSFVQTQLLGIAPSR